MKKLFIKTKIITIISFALFATVIISCDNEENVIPENEYSEIIDESYASEVFDEVEDLGDEAIDYLDNATTKSISEVSGYGNYNRLSPCATVTRVYGQDTVSVTIDFGEVNCLCNDGRERRGKIYINHYGYYWGEGGVEIIYSFEDYFVDDNQLIGTKHVYRHINDAGNRQSDVVVDGAMILSDDQGTITWYAERTREVVEGSDTHYKSDDVIEVTGSSYGTLADGTDIISEITTPLIRINEPGCYRYFVSGVRVINIGDEPEIIIDYGDGTCDNLAEITQDGVTRIVEIRRRRPIW
ncbi:MAG: hypothetical protein PF485_04480 [Bacteroidales bacterium]|jgi:hypothetical protein|nr:hypothetical protein [Bacteroidales bacterium]